MYKSTKLRYSTLQKLKAISQYDDSIDDTVGKLLHLKELVDRGEIRLK